MRTERVSAVRRPLRQYSSIALSLDGLRRAAVALALGASLPMLLVPAAARAEDASPGLATLPSFLGADSLKALEAARAEREAETAKAAPPLPAAVAPSAAAPATKPDRRKSQEEEAKRRAEAMRRLAPADGGVKRLSPDEARLLEAEDAAKARADQRAREPGAAPARAAAVTTITETPSTQSLATQGQATSAEALGQAAAQVKALLADPAPEPAAAPVATPAAGPHSVSLMEKVLPAPQPKPAETPPTPAAAARSQSGKLIAPLSADPPARGPAPGACAEPQVKTAPQSAGRMLIEIDSACRAKETVRILYGAVTFERVLDSAGRLSFTLDLFQGKDATLSLAFNDQSSRDVAIVSADLDKVSKIAVVWRAPVNLDLHAFEYLAHAGQKGHVWSGSSSDADGALGLAKAESRGHGFLSSTATAAGGGDKVEVYTFWHVPGQDGGAVTLAVDYETRGDIPKAAACGAGPLASVEMQVWRLLRGEAPESESRVMAAAPCDAPLAEAVRYNPDSMPQLRVR